MKPVSASATSQHALGRARVIGLFLARLLACLLRLREHGEAPPHLAKMASSADEMVHAYICNLAAVRLKTMGYTHAARALRARRVDRTAPIKVEPASPDELIARLETTITKLNNAETLSDYFARLVFCALCMVFTGEDRPSNPVVTSPLNDCFAVAPAFAPQHMKMTGRGPP